MTTTPTISRETATGYDGGAEQCCKSCGQLLGYRSTDKLTGLLDRWGWDASAPQAFARAVQQHRPTALLIVDLDWFKLVNDEFGHPAGDAVLRSTAAVLRNASREGDLVGRYGGDEFLMLLSPTDLVGATEVALRIRAGLAAMTVLARTRVDASATITGQTASIGIATYRPDRPSDLYGLLLDADSALREAKRGGRDQIRVMSSSLGEGAF